MNCRRDIHWQMTGAIKKGLFRFRQLGGWRLLRAYSCMDNPHGQFVSVRTLDKA